MDRRVRDVRTVVVIPTYQEADTIGAILDRIDAVGAPVDVLVVDDNSPDGTADLVAARAGTKSGLHLLRRPGKAGLGSAYRAGFRWAADAGYDVFVEMDADGSHDPAALPSLLAAIEDGADLAIGSRYVPGGSIPDWEWHRRALSAWGNRYVDAMLHLGVRDATAGYRAYRAELVDRLDLDTIRADGYGFQIEMTYRSVQHDATIVERPISFTDRTVGDSKMSGSIIVEALGLVTKWGISARLSRLRRAVTPGRRSPR